jgi:hypothetical protein
MPPAQFASRYAPATASARGNLRRQFIPEEVRAGDEALRPARRSRADRVPKGPRMGTSAVDELASLAAVDAAEKVESA